MSGAHREKGVTAMSDLGASSSITIDAPVEKV
jgi:hypothetical protein